MKKELKIKERVMLKKLVTSAVIVIGMFFVFAGQSNEATPVVCENVESRDCWTLDNEKGWMYNAPMLEVTPTNVDTENWSFDDNYGWIYNTPAIEITPDEIVENWSFDENLGWIYQVEEITIVG
ncbi:MAG: hypothetical protein HOI42_08290 [Candidatus Marinimicrobia bacterium]|jgi:hypothetical protein|nr:hypothetical protein [Candidatus Neomarinimicrobiota bacterium]